MPAATDSAGAQPLRLFFALPCPAALGAEICAWRDRLSLAGRPVPAANLHITLAFLGAQPAQRLPQLLALGEAIRGEAFCLRLGRLGELGEGFTCLFPSPCPPALEALATRLREGLEALGLAIETRPFVPHLTLLRHSRASPSPPARCFAWEVQRFGLYLSCNAAEGVHYRELGSWPLANRHADLLPGAGASN